MNEWMRREDALDTKLRNDESIAQNGQTIHKSLGKNRIGYAPQ